MSDNFTGIGSGDTTIASNDSYMEGIEGTDLGKHIGKETLVGYVNKQYTRSKEARRVSERKWIQCYRDYRGEYNGYQRALIEKLRQTYPTAADVFVKISKTKATNAYSNILDILFSDDKFPIVVKPSKKPEGVATIVHTQGQGQGQQQPPQPSGYGFKGDGASLPPGSTHNDLLAGDEVTYGKMLGANSTVVEGTGTSPNDVTMYPADDTAWELEKLMQDQLTETNAELALRKCAWEAAILGTGCIKGPMSSYKTVHKWVLGDDGKPTYQPEVKLAPEIYAPSIWNVYPDPDSKFLPHAEYVIERHLIGRNELRGWKKKYGFDKEAINEILLGNPQYTQEYWEVDLKDNLPHQHYERYEVLEYWGYINEDLANLLNLEFNQAENVQINAFVCQNKVLKVVLNPFIPQRIPYYLVPYEELAYQVWGVGVPENMTDSQGLVNAHWRAAIDNLNLAGNVMLEVNQNQLMPGQDMTIRPGKIWRKQGGAPGQSIYSIDFKDTSQSHMVALDKAKQLADDETGIPGFASGSGALPSAARTSGTVSMLMGAAALNIKTVIKNFDTYLLQPLGENLFHWNMQFNEDNPEIRGDYEIVAQGTASLMQKEVKSQRLLTFVQVAASNPAMAPMVNYDYVIKELAKSMDLNPQKVINDPVAAKLMAQMIGMMNGSQPQQPQGNPAGANPNDMQGSGGGNMGVGGISQPGEPQFSGNKQ